MPVRQGSRLIGTEDGRHDTYLRKRWRGRRRGVATLVCGALAAGGLAGRRRDRAGTWGGVRLQSPGGPADIGDPAVR